jgi:hypothetical protein
VSHVRGGTPWPWLPPGARRWLRLAAEAAFGLVNPVLYLVVLQPSIPELRATAVAWHTVLTAGAWLLLAAFWSLRIFGAALEPHVRALRGGVLTLLGTAFGWLLIFAAKDIGFLRVTVPSNAAPLTLALNILRICPLYLVPAVLLWEHIRLAWAAAGGADRYGGLFVLPGRAARAAVAGAVGVLVLSAALGAHRRSEANVRALVGAHRDTIEEAGRNYGVDPRLIASIVYVTHRDQLSPFRDELERVFVSAWARNMRGEIGVGSPEHVDRIGTDENPLLNRALDVSVGLAQIKPRTAQTASVLAAGLLPDELPRPGRDSYRDIEPPGDAWNLPAARRLRVVSPIPVPGARHVAAAALLDDRSNLATCALILALYQHHWESVNPAWSLRERPEILATLYQLGFARSRPHAAPRSNAFGTRVRGVLDEPWLDDLGFSSHARMAPQSSGAGLRPAGEDRPEMRAPR